MARSSLLGTHAAAGRAPGHDSDLLGPSDSSDSGSDVAGLDDVGDPDVPIDVIARDSEVRSGVPAEAVQPGSDSDAAGSGERRSAASDAGEPEAADISPDRIIDLSDETEGVFDDGALERLRSVAAWDDENEDDEDEWPPSEEAPGRHTPRD
jgi:hypothetical protein